MIYKDWFVLAMFGASLVPMSLSVYLLARCAISGDVKNGTEHKATTSTQDLYNMLQQTHSKDDMYKIMSKLLYSEVQKTEDILKNVSSAELRQLVQLQKTVLHDIQEVIKVRSENKQENSDIVKQSEVKFQNSFLELNTFIRDQAVRAISNDNKNQSQTQISNASIQMAQLHKTR